MSLRKRHDLTPDLRRILEIVNRIPPTFVAADYQHGVRVTNALDAALDNIRRAHREITKEINR